MADGRSRADLLAFLDYLGQKGLIPPNTASARKASANKVLAVLSEDEASDVTLLNPENLFTRFGHLHKSDYSPDSLQTYVSRTRTSLEDFKRYCDAPLTSEQRDRTDHAVGHQMAEPSRYCPHHQLLETNQTSQFQHMPFKFIRFQSGQM